MKIRNISYAPYLQKEGRFYCPLPSPPPQKSDGKVWYEGLQTYERLYYHQTLNSVRKSKRYIPNPKIPRDDLDFQMQSRYDHARELFPDKVDPVLQRETISEDTFRVLRNTETIEEKKPEKLGHPLRIGGLTEKLSPYSVKLINSGHSTQLINNGYSRQQSDGNFFHY